ncbi:hypothetical protein FN846DRAFT_123380 [Sphaerosporella brunnea]|uniref:Yeast cell wall synthesis Kre9/Knh1-like N-terminal domain-containing protein n=1 Tax=Sphaerosporella brunnea TaxID=1250544 RepID=A0A5J5ES60_9PEZI|nr:hypothetical protein FN846DRAFT_123380 [Sphaerosporella brunnea]
MRFTSIFAVAVAGLSALASAVAMPDSGSANQNTVFAPVASSVVKAGVKFNIQWAPNAGKYVDLVLRKGTDETQLQEVQVICTRLPNVGLFIWEPSTELAGGSDYSIEVTSHDPAVNNYSAKFKIDSNGAGIKPSTTIQPTTTYAISASKTGGGAASYASATDDASAASGAPAAEVSTFKGAAGKTQLESWVVMGAAAFAGLVAGGAVVL